MFSVQKSLRLALVAALGVVASAAESQADSRFVFGKEPVARHNRAVLARKAQASYGYRSAARYSNSNSTYGGTAMVQTYPRPSATPSYATRSYVTPVAGYRVQTAANAGHIVR
ncbi:hypothetical protein Pan44_54010 [Caulifigura coniformis]|uniref:Uncharacterized protein n=1 Tax=Caulifigura coniformis TaxID=2527983 RepID=A0A517SMH9_9PLAN|nr:hypothetical protein [Caulifigura coniformis]QDT57333.1 hypothetical protein Pan44_54010 [Caulifigura coniformis]